MKWRLLSYKFRGSPPEVFCKKGAVNNFEKFTRKHLRRGLFFNKVAGNIFNGCLCFPAPGPLLGPWPWSWSPFMAPNLYLPALASNLYLPALAPNLYLPALAPTLRLLALALNLYLPALAVVILLKPVVVILFLLNSHSGYVKLETYLL